MGNSFLTSCLQAHPIRLSCNSPRKYAVDGVSDLGFSISNANKDVKYFVQMLDDMGTHSQIAEATSANLQAALDAGQGDGQCP